MLTRIMSLPGTLLVAALLAGAWNTPVISGSVSHRESYRTVGVSRPGAASGRTPHVGARPRVFLAQLPLYFELNQGQADKSVQFLYRGAGCSLFLTRNEMALSLHNSNCSLRKSPEKHPDSLLRIRLLAANPRANMNGDQELPGKSNYFLGANPAQWRTNVPHYKQVHCQGIYPGIDLVYYGNGRQLEHDFLVKPGANPAAIRLGFEGLAPRNGLRIDSNGDLRLQTTAGEVTLGKPFVYQQISGRRKVIPGCYTVRDSSDPGAPYCVGFHIGVYDHRLPLTIDPVLAYSTYLGGIQTDESYGIAVDSSGNIYVTGYTYSPDFPTTNSSAPKLPVFEDAFVTKLDPTGSTILYSTCVGGNGAVSGQGIALDSSGSVYITGWTTSINFPTINAFQANAGGGAHIDPDRGYLVPNSDAFVAKLDPTGSTLVYSTYLGGSDDDKAKAIAVDSMGNVYITGNTFSGDFPTANPLQARYGGGQDRTGGDAFVAKLSPSGTDLAYSTYLGGRGDEFSQGIALDPSGDVYVAGYTRSINFPTANAIQPALGAYQNAYVAKLNPSGSTLIYSTYLGGSISEQGNAIAVDSDGNAYLTGKGNGVFVTKLNALGTGIMYAATIGSSGYDSGTGIALDSSGSAYITGTTQSAKFPTVSPVQAVYGGWDDAFVAELDPSGSSLIYSTYLGGSGDDEANGIALGPYGDAYITGYTKSYNFPTVRALVPGHGGGFYGSGDAFVSILSKRLPTTTTVTTSINPSGVNQAFTLTATVSAPDGIPTGTITFRDRAVVLDTIPIDTNGHASLSSSTLALGSHFIIAYYSGDSKQAPSISDGLFQVVVAKPFTHFSLTAPSTVTVGTPFTVSILALDEDNNSTGYSGSVQFTSSDAAAILPDNSNGSITSNLQTYDGFRLNTMGSQTITATDTGNSSITGSATIKAAPAPPTGLTATASIQDVSLQWNLSPAAESYNVKRSTSKGGPYTALTPSTMTNSFVDTNVVSGTTYYYVVAAQANGAEGFDSVEISAIPGRSWSAVGLAVGPDNKTKLLWKNVSGSAAIWSVDNSGSFASSNAFGPYAGWGANDIAVGGDGIIRVLWMKRDFSTGLWLMDSEGAYETSSGYGPYPGWVAGGISAGSDNLARILWSGSKDVITIGSVNNSGNLVTPRVYGPYSGFTAAAIATGADNLTRILWTSIDGAAVLWLVGADNTYMTSYGFGPYPGWKASDIAVGSDNQVRLLWTNDDGRMDIWSVDNTGIASYGPPYGPYSGYTAQKIAAGQDGLTRLLWHNSDGSMALWLMAADNTYQASYGYGPY